MRKTTSSAEPNVTSLHDRSGQNGSPTEEMSLSPIEKEAVPTVPERTPTTDSEEERQREAVAEALDIGRAALAEMAELARETRNDDNHSEKDSQSLLDMEMIMSSYLSKQKRRRQKTIIQRVVEATPEREGANSTMAHTDEPVELMISQDGEENKEEDSKKFDVHVSIEWEGSTKTAPSVDVSDVLGEYKRSNSPQETSTNPNDDDQRDPAPQVESGPLELNASETSVDGYAEKKSSKRRSKKKQNAEEATAHANPSSGFEKTLAFLSKKSKGKSSKWKLGFSKPGASKKQHRGSRPMKKQKDAEATKPDKPKLVKSNDMEEKDERGWALKIKLRPRQRSEENLSSSKSEEKSADTEEPPQATETEDSPEPNETEEAPTPTDTSTPMSMDKGRAPKPKDANEAEAAGPEDSEMQAKPAKAEFKPKDANEAEAAGPEYSEMQAKPAKAKFKRGGALQSKLVGLTSKQSKATSAEDTSKQQTSTELISKLTGTDDLRGSENDIQSNLTGTKESIKSESSDDSAKLEATSKAASADDSPKPEKSVRSRPNATGTKESMPTSTEDSPDVAKSVKSKSKEWGDVSQAIEKEMMSESREGKNVSQPPSIEEIDSSDGKKVSKSHRNKPSVIERKTGPIRTRAGGLALKINILPKRKRKSSIARQGKKSIDSLQAVEEKTSKGGWIRKLISKLEEEEATLDGLVSAKAANDRKSERKAWMKKISRVLSDELKRIEEDYLNGKGGYDKELRTLWATNVLKLLEEEERRLEQIAGKTTFGEDMLARTSRVRIMVDAFEDIEEDYYDKMLRTTWVQNMVKAIEEEEANIDENVQLEQHLQKSWIRKMVTALEDGEKRLALGAAAEMPTTIEEQNARSSLIIGILLQMQEEDGRIGPVAAKAHWEWIKSVVDALDEDEGGHAGTDDAADRVRQQSLQELVSVMSQEAEVVAQNLQRDSGFAFSICGSSHDVQDATREPTTKQNVPSASERELSVESKPVEQAGDTELRQRLRDALTPPKYQFSRGSVSECTVTSNDYSSQEESHSTSESNNQKTGLMQGWLVDHFNRACDYAGENKQKHQIPVDGPRLSSRNNRNWECGDCIVEEEPDDDMHIYSNSVDSSTDGATTEAEAMNYSADNGKSDGFPKQRNAGSRSFPDENLDENETNENATEQDPDENEAGDDVAEGDVDAEDMPPDQSAKTKWLANALHAGDKTRKKIGAIGHGGMKAISEKVSDLLVPGPAPNRMRARPRKGPRVPKYKRP